MHWNYTVVIIFSLSIFIAGIIGLFRFAQIQPVYRPFIYLIWIGCITEVLSIYFAYRYHNNLAIQTIYTLCESLFLLWFFTKLGTFNNHKNLLYLLLTIFLIIWLADNFWSGAFGSRYSYYFDIIYALFIVLLSIGAINDLLFIEKEILRNPTFLICMGLIIFFTYQIIQRMFGLYGLKESAEFRRSVQGILIIINFLVNLLYALAVLCMRKRRLFTFEF